MTKRHRTAVALLGSVCSICQGSDLVLVESRNSRGTWDRFNRNWTEHLRRYELCNTCRTRSVVHEHGADVHTDGLGIPVQRAAG